MERKALEEEVTKKYRAGNEAFKDLVAGMLIQVLSFEALYAVNGHLQRLNEAQKEKQDAQT